MSRWIAHKRLCLIRAIIDFVIGAFCINAGLHLSYIGSKGQSALFYLMGIIFAIYTFVRLEEFRDA